jgi:hypothetical protein
VKNVTNRIFICHKQVNNDTKSNSYSLKRQQNYFCNGTLVFHSLKHVFANFAEVQTKEDRETALWVFWKQHPQNKRGQTEALGV